MYTALCDANEGRTMEARWPPNLAAGSKEVRVKYRKWAVKNGGKTKEREKTKRTRKTKKEREKWREKTKRTRKTKWREKQNGGKKRVTGNKNSRKIKVSVKVLFLSTSRTGPTDSAAR